MGTGRRVTLSPSLRLREEWAGLAPGGSDHPQGGHSFPSILLGWSHWSMAQGAQRKLAARWAWDRSCRDALGLWRRRLAQWQEAEQWAQERGRRRVQDALQHWHSSWQSEWGTGTGPTGEGGRARVHQGDRGVCILQHRVQQWDPTGHAQDPGAWTLVPGSHPHFHSLAVVDCKQAT